MGKTSFALGVAAHAAIEKNLPVLFFSLEMSHLELTQRLLCSEARVDSSRMRNGKLHESDWPKVVRAIGKLGEAPLFIDDNPNLTVMEIRAKARRLKSREGLGLIVVDYLQLMSGHGHSREPSGGGFGDKPRLQDPGGELSVPVVALSQLSRSLEARADNVRSWRTCGSRGASSRTRTSCCSYTGTRFTTRTRLTRARRK